MANDAADFDPDPLASYGYQVRATHRAFDRLLQQQLAEHKLNNGFWYVLRVLWEQEGLTQRELSREVNLTESSMVLMLNAMQTANLVRRNRDRLDKRRLRIHLTPKARALKRKLLPYAGKINAIAAQGISVKDRAVMLAVLAKMKHNLETAARAAKPPQ
jgi:MarR family transcriptional regulator, organic hydroperoxide resistance regulator